MTTQNRPAAPCCGATHRLDHDFECRFSKSQIDLPEWDVIAEPDIVSQAMEPLPDPTEHPDDDKDQPWELVTTLAFVAAKQAPDLDTECRCPACLWFQNEPDNVSHLFCNSGSDSELMCTHPGCTCPRAFSDLECEGCWLWSK